MPEATKALQIRDQQGPGGYCRGVNGRGGCNGLVGDGSHWVQADRGEGKEVIDPHAPPPASNTAWKTVCNHALALIEERAAQAG